MIRVYRWSGAVCSGWAGAEALPPSATGVAEGDGCWVDLVDPSPEEEDLVFTKFLPVHTLTLGDVTKPRREPEQGAHFPKVEEFPDYLFVVSNPLPLSSRNGADAAPVSGAGNMSLRRRPQLSAVLTHTVLITHHYQNLACVDAVRRYVERHEATVHRGPDYLFHLVLDEMVDEYAPVVDRLAARLSRLESAVFAGSTPTVPADLLRLKRRVIGLRKTLVHEREVLARLVRGGFALVDDREIAYYRNVYDHLVRYTELTEGAREMASDLMQTHLAAASHRLNEVMKVLTMISTIGMICAIIAGIYGMNFEHMPELKWRYGYPFALGLMATAVVTTIGFFRWRNWL